MNELSIKQRDTDFDSCTRGLQKTGFTVADLHHIRLFSTSVTMLNRAGLLSGITMLMMLLEMKVDAAPTEKGSAKPSAPLPSLSHTSAVNPSQYMKRWLLSTKTGGLDGAAKSTDKTTAGAITAGIRSGKSRVSTGTDGPDKQAKMLKMISALEELHRTFSSTLSSQITIMSRAGGRNPGRKNKVLPVAEGGVKPTTAALSTVDSTASRASAEVAGQSLTGRNLKKSLSTQAKKTNKRVCFWKYCSQN